MGDDKKVSKTSSSLLNSPLPSYKKVGNMKLCWHEGLEIMGVYKMTQLKSSIQGWWLPLQKLTPYKFTSMWSLARSPSRTMFLESDAHNF
jgi:hypothetical protein